MLQLDDIRIFCIDGGHGVGGALGTEKVVCGVGLPAVAVVLEQVVALGGLVDMLLAENDMLVVTVQRDVLMRTLVDARLVLLLGRDDWLQSLAYPLRGDASTGDLVTDLVVGVVLAPGARATRHRTTVFLPLGSP